MSGPPAAGHPSPTYHVPETELTSPQAAAEPAKFVRLGTEDDSCRPRGSDQFDSWSLLPGILMCFPVERFIV